MHALSGSRPSRMRICGSFQVELHTIICRRRHLDGLLVSKESFHKVGHVVTSVGAIDGKEWIDEGSTLRKTAWLEKDMEG
jgi:hypothetical protein